METAATRNGKTNAKPAKLGREVQARLGQQLRAMYDDVVNQGVPDRFAELLNRLERRWEQGQALMPMDESVRKAVLGAVPSLRAFAISLCGNVDRADDLVQETMLRALANIDSFQPGTNMSAWLFTILRNHFRSEYRKRRREVEDSDGHYAETLKIAARAARPGRVP